MRALQRLFVTVLVLVGLGMLAGRPAMAADLAHGAQVFSANCAACHMGGRNVIVATKTLQKADLEKYGMVDVAAITMQVTKGKNAMPAFLGRLTATDIEDVANYVLDQAEKGWS